MRIGVDLGGSNIRIGIVENGLIIDKITASCKSKEPEKVIIDQLIEMLHSILRNEVLSVGVGVPSIVDAKRGIVYNVENITSWKEVHLKEVLEKEFKLPVNVNNDCNCFALGEYCKSGNSIYENMIFIALGTGVGSGVILNKQLYSGENTCAGEIGSVPYLKHNYEYYCGSQFFIREYGITGKEAFEKASMGSLKELGIWNSYGIHLANLIKLVLFTYDPQIIFLGGSIAIAYDFFSKSMFKTLADFPYPELIKKIKIEKSETVDNAILGAAML